MSAPQIPVTPRRLRAVILVHTLEKDTHMLKTAPLATLVSTRLRTMVALGTGLVLAPSLAFAAVTAGDQLGTTEVDIRAALEERGYVVERVYRDGDDDDDDFEADVVLDGVDYELYIDPETGVVTEIELD
ncbi:MAG: PepSY domain-containing protein [Pseudomonadota bacterium]